MHSHRSSTHRPSHSYGSASVGLAGVPAKQPDGQAPSQRLLRGLIDMLCTQSRMMHREVTEQERRKSEQGWGHPDLRTTAEVSPTPAWLLSSPSAIQ